MSNQQQQEQATTMATNSGDGSMFYPKLGGISTTTTPLPQSLPQSTSLVDQTLYENYNLKWDEASLEQKMAALKLETQKQLLNEFMLRKAQLQNAPIAYPTDIHLHTPKPPSQRNRELYKTALCDFWSAGVPCRFGERCWFAHGPHELRIARFVYPSLHPYDYEVRMNVPNAMPPSYARHFWNMEQRYPVAGAPSTSSMTATLGHNLPIGYERKFRRISPIHENMVNPKDWRIAQRGGASDADSGLGSSGTTNSPEVNARSRESLDNVAYHYTIFPESVNSEAFENNILPQQLRRPLDTLISRTQVTLPRSGGYNRWLSTAPTANVHAAPSLEETGWWADTINDTYPFINRSDQNIQPTTAAGGSPNAQQHYSMCMEQKVEKLNSDH